MSVNHPDNDEEEEQILPKLELDFKPFRLNYMHHPPRITPNYGKKKVQLLPKSKVTRVLLYDNVTQQQILDMKLANIKIEKHRSGRLMDLHRRNFIVQRLKKLKQTTRGKEADVSFPPVQVENNKIVNRRISSEVKLPELEPKQIIGNSESVNGITRMFNTFEVSENNFVEDEIKYEKSVRDPRFQSLQDGLVHLDKPGDGYLELSPSFVKDYSSIPRNIRRIGLLPLIQVESHLDVLD